MEQKALDLSAKLLATENISVRRANTETASFDIKSRLLTLPIWKEMTPEIEDMLVGHEVGHALYTGDRYLEPIKDNPALGQYMNILEDVRIEKLIKRTYPGMRKRMAEGYRQLNSRDFFGLSKIESLEELILIDRINLYFKAGISCGVKFNSQERVLLNRAENTETIEDVIALAQEIYELSKQNAEQQQKENILVKTSLLEEEDMEDEESDGEVESAVFDEDSSGEYSSDSEDDDGEVSDRKPIPSQGAGMETDASDVAESLQPKTYDAFNKRLDELASSDVIYQYWDLDTRYSPEFVIDYKRILTETAGISPAYNTETFMQESSNTVNYLVKEFEMRKSATAYKRSKVAKSGSLDMRKIYSYKLNDDLFKRTTIIPEGKNHGMIMLLDWSGSMDPYLEDTLKQVINLAMFCRRAQIPFRVLAFTTEYTDEFTYGVHKQAIMSTPDVDRETLLDNCNAGFRLLELFSNKMSSVEFNTMVRKVLNRSFQRYNYATGGTPLNHALAWVYANLGDYIKKNNLEKMTFVTLTDGDGSALCSFNGSYLQSTKTEIVGGHYKKIKIKNFIRDNVTKKSYEIDSNSSLQTKALLQMIKDRYGVSVVGFYICRNSFRILADAIRKNLPTYEGDIYQLIDTWRKQIRDNGFASSKSSGRDDLFIVPISSTKIVDAELNVSSDNTARAIATQFGKYMNVKKTSRVLLNQFIEHVA